MREQQWRLILELLSGGPMTLCGGGLGAILSAPPKVSPLRATQDIYRWCPGAPWIYSWFILGSSYLAP